VAADGGAIEILRPAIAGLWMTLRRRLGRLARRRTLPHCAACRNMLAARAATPRSVRELFEENRDYAEGWQ
jgi:hypothetical protein